VELRDKNNNASVVSSRAALLQRDGDVVDLDGSSPVTMASGDDQYYVAVRHRNHLGVMTQNALALSGTATSVNFTSAGQATYGSNARKSVTGAFPAQVLWAGNVVVDDQVKYTGTGNDRDLILQAIGGVVPTNTAAGYLGADVDLNGQVKYTGSDNDRDIILQNIGGVVPTNTRVEQLP
ncbi:MAG: hemagglutinin protein, partial [Flavobacteriales bacterium]|nr:hemagglutinin protein [Flavobacteriales bacterium]